jgi:nitric oxide reductase activation protein
MNEAEVNAWNEFAQNLRKRVRWDLEKIEKALLSALQILPALTADERAEILKIGLKVAERSSKFAVTFLRLAPGVLASIDPSCRHTILRWAEILASESRETLLDFLERSPQTIKALPEKERSIYLDLGLRLASEDWPISLKYFMNLSKISHEISSEKIYQWYKDGLPLIDKNLPAALAYYSLESRHSQERGQAQSTAIFFEEVARPLKLFAQALTGESLSLKPLPELREGMQNSFYFLPWTDGETIYLPLVSKEFSSPALNVSAYRLATAHQAGYLEFGTFTFKLSSVYDLFPPELFRACLQSIEDKGKSISPLEAFLRLFPKTNLARDIFHLLEGSRIDHCLRREYRGLKKEMDLFLKKTMEKRPSPTSLPLQEAVLESILRISVLRKTDGNFPEVVTLHLQELLSLLTPILEKGATVADSARATVILYRWLSALPNFRSLTLHPEEELKGCPSLNQSLFAIRGMDFAPRLAKGEEPYSSPAPLPHRGQFRPELVQKKLRLREIKNLLNQMAIGVPLSAEELKKLLKMGLEVETQTFKGEGERDFQGLFLTDLEGLKKVASSNPARKKDRKELKAEMADLLAELGEDSDGAYYYDEWDYRISDYRVKWCRLKEKEVEVGSSGFVSEVLGAYADLVAEVRRQFQMLKPERFKKIPHLERGEEIDLNAAIEASVDRRAGHSPSEKIYIEKNRKDRDFSTLFLLDMSASTDERVNGKNKTPELTPDSPAEKKVIDIEREALVVMAEALKEIGDEYAIFGFSGYGRKDVDFFTIKNFSEEYGEKVKGRIGEIKPQRSTRMGPAIRHAVEKMNGRESKIKNIILISDGYPQDYDYGEDRAGKEYALQDTMRALEEATRKNIHTFCITVDRAGHDYLRKMCHPSKYLVIEETAELPRELPKIYRRLTT